MLRILNTYLNTKWIVLAATFSFSQPAMSNADGTKEELGKKLQAISDQIFELNQNRMEPEVRLMRLSDLSDQLKYVSQYLDFTLSSPLPAPTAATTQPAKRQSSQFDLGRIETGLSFLFPSVDSSPLEINSFRNSNCKSFSSRLNRHLYGDAADDDTTKRSPNQRSWFRGDREAQWVVDQLASICAQGPKSGRKTSQPEAEKSSSSRGSS